MSCFSIFSLNSNMQMYNSQYIWHILYVYYCILYSHWLISNKAAGGPQGLFAIGGHSRTAVRLSCITLLHSSKTKSFSLPDSVHKLSVSRDFRPPFLSWFEPIWAPDKQANVFSNSVSILLRYSITKFEKFDSGVCITPQSQNLSLSNSKNVSSNLFLHDRIVYT